MNIIYKKNKNRTSPKEIQFSEKGDANDVDDALPADLKEDNTESTEISEEPTSDNLEGELPEEDSIEELPEPLDDLEVSSNDNDEFEYLRGNDPSKMIIPKILNIFEKMILLINQTIRKISII